MDVKTTEFFMTLLDSNPSFFSGPFGYTEVRYIDNKTPIILKCTEHGNFKVLPRVLLRKNDVCTKCNAERRNKNLRSSLPEFISRARAVHGNKYDYSLIEKYVNAKTKVLLRCNRCESIFEQKPHSHLEGKGCRYCKFDNLKDSKGYLYVIAGNTSSYKIGISNNPDRRMYHLHRDTPFPIKPLKMFDCTSWSNAHRIEKLLHERFKPKNAGYKGFQGCTEWFTLRPIEVQELFRLLEREGLTSKTF